MDKFWTMLLIPFYLVIVFTVIGIPMRWLVSKLPPDSKIRRLLLMRIG